MARSFTSQDLVALLRLNAAESVVLATELITVADAREKRLKPKKLPEAIIEYRRAVQSDPRLGQARLRLAEAYAETGEPVNALREFARAAELLPEDKDAQIKAGNFMLLAGLYQDAKGLGERMLARTPDSVEAQILIANALAAGKKMDDAIAAFQNTRFSDIRLSRSAIELKSLTSVAASAIVVLPPRARASRSPLATRRRLSATEFNGVMMRRVRREATSVAKMTTTVAVNPIHSHSSPDGMIVSGASYQRG